MLANKVLAGAVALAVALPGGMGALYWGYVSFASATSAYLTGHIRECYEGAAQEVRQQRSPATTPPDIAGACEAVRRDARVLDEVI